MTRIGVIGAGRVGAVLAAAMRTAGHEITSVAGESAASLTRAETLLPGVPVAKPTYITYGLVTVSFHWNNFLWPLVVTNSVDTRPITVGLQVFSTVEQGVDWSLVTAATLLSVAPLLLAFLVFQRQFVQSFMRAGIR